MTNTAKLQITLSLEGAQKDIIIAEGDCIHVEYVDRYDNPCKRKGQCIRVSSDTIEMPGISPMNKGNTLIPITQIVSVEHIDVGALSFSMPDTTN
jgi:hypothetical protein